MPRLSYRRYLQRIHRQRQAAPAVILHYDTASQDLGVWFWPVGQDGSRITPTDLLGHRVTHEFRAPCCLCASNTATGIGYTESAIYRPTQGPHFGEYVAACALGRCGYFIHLELIYVKTGLILRKYPVRSIEAHVPPPVMYMPQRRFPDVLNPPASAIVKYERPAGRSDAESVVARLLRLDSCIRAGVPEAEFNRLFAKCRCGLVMTRRVFRQHVCAVAPATNPPIIIDLTSDSEDNEDMMLDGAAPSQPSVIDLTADSDDN